jgi:catechol 2,3-dioxygenase-like lactoylglutathione lyase family enzyme
MDLRLEVVQVPVSDVDRAKRFYTEKVGFHADHDTRLNDAVRVVQLTPPGSACSIVIGSGLSEMKPGCFEGLQLTVTDMDQVRGELVGRGVDVSDVKVLGRPGRPGFRHAYFHDPDGNGWALQEIPAHDQRRQAIGPGGLRALSRPTTASVEQ